RLRQLSGASAGSADRATPPQSGCCPPHVEIGGRLFALDFVGVPIDQQGQNVAARDDRVDRHRLTIQAALPSACGFFKLEPVWLAARVAAHYDFVNHKISAALPSVPSVSNWMEPKPDLKVFRRRSHSC